MHILPGSSGVSTGPFAPPRVHRAAVQLCRGRGAGGQGGCCRRIPHTAAECLFFHFFFFKNSSCSSLALQTRTWPLTQPPSPTRPGTTWARVCHSPTLPSQGLQSQWVHTVPVCLPLCPYSPHDFKQPGLSWCCSNLVWQGREPLTRLSPKNPVEDLAGTRQGAAATLVPRLDPGTLLS